MMKKRTRRHRVYQYAAGHAAPRRALHRREDSLAGRIVREDVIEQVNMRFGPADFPHQAVNQLRGVADELNFVARQHRHAADFFRLADHRLIIRKEIQAARAMMLLPFIRIGGSGWLAIGMSKSGDHFPVPFDAARPQPGLTDHEIKDAADVRMKENDPQPGDGCAGASWRRRITGIIATRISQPNDR